MPQPNFDAGHAEDVSKHPQQRRVTVNTAVRSTPLTLIVKAMVVSWLAIRCSNGQGGEREQHPYCTVRAHLGMPVTGSPAD